MNILPITDKYMPSFKIYCQKHRYEHDESYLYEEDLHDFDPYHHHPTWLLFDDHVIVGVLSLMLDDYFIASHKARIRIFHCISNNIDHYKGLLDAVIIATDSVQILEMFLPNRVKAVQDIIKALNFNYYRTSYVMVRKDQGKAYGTFPKPYELKPFVHNEDEVAYAHIRNTAFKSLKGSEAPMSLEVINKLTNDPYLLNNGLQILWYKNTAVGILRMIKEEDQSGDYSFVAPIALLPEHQGKGLGTQLLRAGIAIGQDNGYENCMLSVNAENEQALGLYTKVGFSIDEAVSCFHKDIK